MEKIVDRIRKLLALAGSPNEHEAALAAKKAHELLAQHNLSLSEIEGKEEEEITQDESIETRPQPWQRSVVGGVAKLYFCYYYYAPFYGTTRTGRSIRKDRHNLIGAAHNVAVAKMMVEYLLETVERLATEGAKTVSQWERSRYICSFKNSCALRLRARLKELWENAQKPTVTETGTNLPTLRSLYEQAEADARRYVTSCGIHLHTRNSRMGISHGKGRADGHVAGSSISLNQQIGGNKAGRHLLSNK